MLVHGGSFALPTDFTKRSPLQFKPTKAGDNDDDVLMKGRVLLSRRETASKKDNQSESDLFAVPRSRCIIFHSDGSTSVGRVDIRHGEAETRFLAVTTEFISPVLTTNSGGSAVRLGGEGAV